MLDLRFINIDNSNLISSFHYYCNYQLFGALIFITFIIV